MALVLDANSIEGLDPWVYTTHGELSDEMRLDLSAVLILGAKSTTYHGWLLDLPPDAAAHRSFAAFLAWLNTFSVEDYRDLLDSSLAMMHEKCGEAKTDVNVEARDDEAALRGCYGEMVDELHLERLLHLYRHPAEFKAQLVSVTSRFWEQFYRQEFERSLEVMERSVRYHRQQSYSADLVTTFADVTGRRFPKGDEVYYENTERVLFVPSCHIGPYVMLSPCDEASQTILIHYNARTTSTQEVEATPTRGASIQDLFPPLKALADETRLQILSILDGRELYAQEIVDELDISQSAVSRHLKLMVTGGILDVRKEESMKFYAINQEALTALGQGLRRFKAPSGDG
jgi:DNA-binding transcriptional ArsR family regulator